MTQLYGAQDVSSAINLDLFPNAREIAVPVPRVVDTSCHVYFCFTISVALSFAMMRLRQFLSASTHSLSSLSWRVMELSCAHIRESAKQVSLSVVV